MKMEKGFFYTVRDGYESYAAKVSYLPQIILLLPTLAVIGYASFFSVANLLEFIVATGELPYGKRFNPLNVMDWVVWFEFKDMMLNLGLLLAASIFLRLMPFANEGLREEPKSSIGRFFEVSFGMIIVGITATAGVVFAIWMATATVMMIIPALFGFFFNAVLVTPYIALTLIVNIFAFFSIFYSFRD